MKRLLLTFGLVIAFFVSDVQASIYDTSTSQSPKLESVVNYLCTSNYSSETLSTTTPQCTDFAKGLYTPSEGFYYGECSALTPTPSSPRKTVSCEIIQSADDSVRSINIGKTLYIDETDIRSCPPDDFPLYSHGHDSDGDGEIDKCYNPLELDNASNCDRDYNAGTLLTASSGSPDNVCKTNPETGAKCAYEKTTYGDNIPVYSGNLEANCFDMTEGDEYPDYEDPETPQPQPDSCQTYGSGYVCAEDPSNVCNAQGVCDDGCGYVNDQFVCFRDENCTGDACDPPPVNCTTNPDAPSCQEPNPEPCTGDDCAPNPEPCTGDNCDPDGGGSGGGGGSSFELDYQRLADSMKDAANLLIDDNEISDGQAIKDQIGEGAEQVNTEIDEFMSNSLFDDIVAVPNQNIFSGMENMLPNGGSCSPLSIGEHVSIDICRVADFVRPILYFVFAFLTLIYLRDLLSVTLRSTGAQ